MNDASLICPACHASQSTPGACQSCKFESVSTIPELESSLGPNWRRLTWPSQRYFCVNCGTFQDSWSLCPKCHLRTEPERVFSAAITQWILDRVNSEKFFEDYATSEGFIIDKDRRLCFGFELSDILHREGCTSREFTPGFAPITSDEKAWVKEWQAEVFSQFPEKLIADHQFCMEVGIRDATCDGCGARIKRPTVLVMFRHLGCTFRSEYWLDNWRTSNGKTILDVKDPHQP